MLFITKINSKTNTEVRVQADVLNKLIGMSIHNSFIVMNNPSPTQIVYSIFV